TVLPPMEGKTMAGFADETGIGGIRDRGSVHEEPPDLHHAVLRTEPAGSRRDLDHPFGARSRGCRGRSRAPTVLAGTGLEVPMAPAEVHRPATGAVEHRLRRVSPPA